MPQVFMIVSRGDWIMRMWLWRWLSPVVGLWLMVLMEGDRVWASLKSPAHGHSLGNSALPIIHSPCLSHPLFVSWPSQGEQCSSTTVLPLGCKPNSNGAGDRGLQSLQSRAKINLACFQLFFRWFAAGGSWLTHKFKTVLSTVASKSEKVWGHSSVTKYVFCTCEPMCTSLGTVKN